MKAVVGLGKLIALLFWLALLANLLSPFAHPFATLMQVAGGLILLIHIVELLALGARLKGRPRPWLDRAQVLLFGIFHFLSLPQSAPQEGSHA
jgi:putative membrane protein